MGGVAECRSAAECGRLGGVWLGVGRQGGESECGSAGWNVGVCGGVAECGSVECEPERVSEF